MHPPIRCCTRGHSYCDSCKDRMKCCPICRSAHHHGTNVLMEKFYSHLLLYCKNKEKGCTALALGNQILSHEKVCPVNWRPCPYNYVGYCTWRGPKTQSVDHCREVHPNSSYGRRNVVFVYCLTDSQ